MTHPNRRFNNDIRMQSPDILKSSYIEVTVFFNNLLLCCATEICNLSSQPALKVCSTFFQGFDDENIRQWHILKTKFRWDVLWASPMIEKHFLSEIFNNKSQKWPGLKSLNCYQNCSINLKWPGTWNYVVFFGADLAQTFFSQDLLLTRQLPLTFQPVNSFFLRIKLTLIFWFGFEMIKEYLRITITRTVKLKPDENLKSFLMLVF